MDITTFLTHPVTQAALTGLLGAAAVDLAAFRSWKTHQEALTYSWSIAAWRWFQGAAVGALTALGLLAAS